MSDFHDYHDFRDFGDPRDLPTPSQEPAPSPAPGRPAHHVRNVLAGVLAGIVMGGGAAAAVGATSTGGAGRTAAVTAVAHTTSATSATLVPSTAAGGTLDVRAVIARVEPAVVTINTSSGGGRFGQSGAGTGMILTPDGKVLTNAHVVNGATAIQVSVPGHGTHTATILGENTTADVAVIQLEGVSGLPTVTLADSSTAQVGDPVVAIGNTLALDGAPTVTTGIVSALNRSIDDDNGHLSNLMQTDAPINPGNSGGPLLNASGQVIGMNTATAGDAQNIGFAITTNQIAPLLSALESGSQSPTQTGGQVGTQQVVQLPADSYPGY